MSGTGFAGYNYMQDVNRSICDSLSNPQPGRLVDKRDGKIYWVAKLKDGLCWMTQNLSLDLDTQIPLTSTLSDVANWTPPSNTSAGNPSGFTGDGNVVVSYNPESYGKWYYNNGSTKTGFLDTTLDWMPTYNEGFISASSYLGADNITICSKTASSYIGNKNSSACRLYYYDLSPINEWHWQAGNYYSWTAATAGDTRTSGSSEQSICPKGWKLPASNNTSIGSFGGLTSDISAGSILVASPYYFVYGGRIYQSHINNAGSDGGYWSSTASSSTHAYRLYFDNSSIYPSSNNLNRYNGYSVRCVAR